MRARQRTDALAVVLVGTAAALGVEFLTPSSVVLRIGDTSTATQLPGRYFLLRDVAVIAIAAIAFGGSLTYLLVDDAHRSEPNGEPAESEPATDADDDPAPTDDLLKARRQEWQEKADRLADSEQTVYEAILEADGVLSQSEIVERTPLSKATVSRSLDSLEAKDLVERKRRGVGNVVLLR
jgi:uncharacterized membrane protein